MPQRIKGRPRSAEREALAAAIATERERTAQVAAAELALQTATQTKWSAATAVTRAKDAVEEALGAVAGHVIAAARGMAEDAPQTVAAARQALRGAEEAHATAVETQRALQSRLDELTRFEESDRDKPRAPAARAIAASPEARKLLADVQHLQAELLKKSAALLFLGSIGAFSFHERIKTDQSEEFSPAASALRKSEQLALVWQQHNHGNLSSVVSWRAAFEALLRDPDAELPAS